MGIIAMQQSNAGKRLKTILTNQRQITLIVKNKFFKSLQKL
ncbi:hypothetical protein NSB1T_09650 [Coprobacter fastidiosus NSB1 = JCM 33896]|nr:hypothetical protein NSB1T_09650 [Coprobacter fastidiosus NSB1 = JCM 33896]